MVGGFVYEQLVDNRFTETFTASLARTENIEHKNLVVAFLQPATRHIKRLLRTDFPYSTHRMAVDIYKTFSECFKVQECVTRLFDLECGTVHAAIKTLAIGIFHLLQRAELQ